MKGFILSLTIGLCLSTGSTCFGFQTYYGEDFKPQVNPDVRSFQFYISPTYWDLMAGREKPTTEFLVESTKYAFSIIERDLQHLGLTFSFAGFKDVDALRQRSSGLEFERKIYIDYSSRLFTLSPNDFAGRAYTIKVNSTDVYASGGIVHMSGKKINWHHPLVENFSTVIHEVLHIIGVGHSTNASSLMAYTENWQPRLSKDDIAAANTVYRYTEEGAQVTVNAKLNDVAAAGVETVWIDITTGKSQVSVTDANGMAKVVGLEAGRYYLAARELTPTGPCFSKPTQGFLSSFYVSPTSSTNQLGSATPISVAEGSQAAFELKLVPGQKKFDCHYIASIWCQTQSDCVANRLKPGASGRANIMNDLSTTHHKTDTNILSGLHSSIVLSSIGSSSPLLFGTTILGDGETPADIGYNLLNYSVADLDVASDAEENTYAALCTAGGETALMSSTIEIMDDAAFMTNEDLWPQFADQFTASDAPRNVIELAQKEPPSKPKQVLGMACGSMGVHGVATSGLLVLVMLFLPLLTLFKRWSIVILLLVFGSIYASSSQAAELMASGWIGSIQEKDDALESSTSFYRFGLQPLQNIFMGLSLGGKFVYESGTRKIAENEVVETFAAFGPSIGYVPSDTTGFCASVTYLMYPTQTIKSETTSVLHGGSGTSIDVGVRASVGPVVLGPIISFNQVSFSKETSDQYESSIALKRSTTQGSLGLWLRL
jgi:hypothetical protein